MENRFPKPSSAKVPRLVAENALIKSLHEPNVVKRMKHRLNVLKLSKAVHPLSTEANAKVMEESVLRILNAEKHACFAGVKAVHNKIITSVATLFNPAIRQLVLNHILGDVGSHIDLALAWLYEEYSYIQGFTNKPTFVKTDQNPEHDYNFLFCAIARTLQDKADERDRDSLFNRLYLECPVITEEATEVLKSVCSNVHRAAEGLRLLHTLAIKRPPRQLIFLNVLLEYTAHENSEIRGSAIQLVVELYGHRDIHSIIEEYAIFYLSFLRLPQPPELLFGDERGRPIIVHKWNEAVVKACLYLYLQLLPINEKLIQELAHVYIQAKMDVKRTVLQLLDGPVREIGVDSTELLTLVEHCPTGAETLVTRVITLLTDHTAPTPELVARVRALYHTKTCDVRFLIPVISGLTKKEVILALPRFIKLKLVVVREVFKKLIGLHTDGRFHPSPLTPGELLIALHNLDASKCGLKTIIKATSICFTEKQAYTQEILAVVMQHLMEQNPLPVLLMRTVIQSLSLYPSLIGFVLNILQRLVLKQVWKHRQAWEGFIKCCQLTQPQSFQVFLQLPAPQLINMFEISPNTKESLCAHVMGFTDYQRSHIPPSIMEILFGTNRIAEEEYNIDIEELTVDMEENSDDPSLHVEPAPPGLD